ncbi:Aste57867_22787 [Aphanomyces stellatus]|uniref:Aste57867_22787 protein n=1 Tax=Aphanomyces stellatus TaxID=120398 RepID=A0A485LKV9_9STRA|nr:hypothetical protein As57867_022717 [Aphanomyces stellatus]VFT99440.1 Aste57867_22787 [Aphanomyces stellatus]
MLYAPKYKERLFTPPLWIFPETKIEMLYLEANKSVLDTTNGNDVQLQSKPDIDIRHINAEDLIQTSKSKTFTEDIHRLAEWLIEHANQISNTPEQLDKVLKVVRPVVQYRSSIEKIEHMRKKRRTNDPDNRSTIMYHASKEQFDNVQVPNNIPIHSKR